MILFLKLNKFVGKVIISLLDELKFINYHVISSHIRGYYMIASWVQTDAVKFFIFIRQIEVGSLLGRFVRIQKNLEHI